MKKVPGQPLLLVSPKIVLVQTCRNVENVKSTWFKAAIFRTYDQTLCKVVKSHTVVLLVGLKNTFSFKRKGLSMCWFIFWGENTLSLLRIIQDLNLVDITKVNSENVLFKIFNLDLPLTVIEGGKARKS